MAGPSEVCTGAAILEGWSLLPQSQQAPSGLPWRSCPVASRWGQPAATALALSRRRCRRPHSGRPRAGPAPSLPRAQRPRPQAVSRRAAASPRVATPPPPRRPAPARKSPPSNGPRNWHARTPARPAPPPLLPASERLPVGAGGWRRQGPGRRGVPT